MSSTPEGNVTVAFRDLTPGSIRDISLSISEDFGQSFRKVTDFSGDNWEIDGCPHNGPSLVKNQQNTYIAWYSGGNKVGVHLAALTHAGELINRLPVNPTGKFIQLALLPEDIVVTAAQQTVQENGKERNQIVVGKVQENKLFEKVLAPDHQQAAFPMIQALGQGQMLVAWKNNQSIYYQVIDAKDITEPAVETKEESLLSMEHHVH